MDSLCTGQATDILDDGNQIFIGLLRATQILQIVGSFLDPFQVTPGRPTEEHRRPLIVHVIGHLRGTSGGISKGGTIAMHEEHKLAIG